MNLRVGDYLLAWDGDRNWTLHHEKERERVGRNGDTSPTVVAFIGYYSNLWEALLSVLAQGINNAEASSVKEVVGAIDEAKRQVLDALFKIRREQLAELPANRLVHSDDDKIVSNPAPVITKPSRKVMTPTPRRSRRK